MNDLLSVGIITAPRERTYIGASLDSYFDHWDRTPHVFAEPDTSQTFHNRKRVIWHQHKTLHGAAFNWVNSLKWLYENTASEYILMCEDDIEWRPGSSEELRSVLRSGKVRLEHGETLQLREVGFISPYCSEKNQWDLGDRDVWTEPRHGSRWMGALTICMHKRVVAQFLTRLSDFFFYTAYKATERAPERTYLHLDHAIGMTVGKAMRLPIVTHNPTLVLHLGEYSTFGGNNELSRVIPSSRLPAL